jgi:hypothetical protein
MGGGALKMCGKLRWVFKASQKGGDAQHHQTTHF